jgi:hypothetical protein
MGMRALLVGPFLFLSACAPTSDAKTSLDAARPPVERADPEEPPTDPGADPLFTAATHVCRLVERKDEGVLAAAFAPDFFDTTPPAKVDATLYEVRGALGLCGSHMKVVERSSPLEGVVAVECEHGVLMLSMALGTAEYRPIMALGIETRTGSKLHDLAAMPPSK